MTNIRQDNNKRILITGSTGFVGTHLSRYLESKGYEITHLRRNTGNAPLHWDNVQATDLDRMHAILHLAGKAHDLKNTSAPDTYFEVNTGLTKKLFDLFLQSSAYTFFYFSSVKAAADTVADILDESANEQPFTAYGKSKLEAERYLLSHALPANKKVIILRPCMIHGPGNRGNLNLLYNFIKRGIPYPLASFHNKRSFLSVDNLCFVILRMLRDEGMVSGIYQVADDETLSTNEVVCMMAKAMGRKPRLANIPPKVVKLIAVVSSWLRLPFNSERLQKLTESYVVSNKKIKAALGIERLPLSASEGLMKTVSGFGNE